MIKKSQAGWTVYSESGKKLSRAYKTKKEAEDRLRQIEFMKHRKKK